MTTLTFLEHATVPLTKQFAADGSIKPYPLVKNLSSNIITVKNITEMYDAIVDNAKLNRCFLKGELTEPLINESRAGKTKTIEPNKILVLDFDGIQAAGIKVKTPISKARLIDYAEALIAMLPELYHNVSYIVQASASLGMKDPEELALHIFFMLDKAIDPGAQKDILIDLNLVDDIQSQLTLSNNGKTLHYPVDIKMAENTRLIYIAAPMFADKRDEFIKQRIILVSKDKQTLPSKKMLSFITHGKLINDINNVVRKLRADAGYPASTAKLRSAMRDGIEYKIIDNPDPMRISPLRVDYEKGFAYFNINNGDSGAYYAFLDNPDMVHNFKDEPSFSMKKADPDFHAQFLQSLATEGSNDTDDVQIALGNRKPFVFRDFNTGGHYNGLRNTTTNTIVKCEEAKKGDLADWMENFGDELPDVIPPMHYEYNPTIPEGWNDSTETDDIGWVNKYRPSKYIIDNEKLSDVPFIRHSEAMNLADYCPTIHKVIYHVLGNSEKEYCHFIHWLAWVIQHRDKAQTAWVITGNQGTGKALLFDDIIKPILDVTVLKKSEDMFDKFLAENIILVLDEFKMGNMTNQDAWASKIREWITEKNATIRAMRTDHYTARTYCSVLIFSNAYDSIHIPTTEERRLNVSPRQEVPLDQLYPTFRTDYYPKIEGEIALFYKYMNTVATDDNLVKTCLNNDAKRLLQLTAESSIDEFCRCLRSGILDYFIDNVMTLEGTGGFMDEYLIPAKIAVRRLILRADDGPQGIFLSELVTIYAVIFPKILTAAKLNSLLVKHGAIIGKGKRIQVSGVKKRGWLVNWKFEDWTQKEATEQYISPQDIKTLSSTLNTFPPKEDAK